MILRAWFTVLCACCSTKAFAQLYNFNDSVFTFNVYLDSYLSSESDSVCFVSRIDIFSKSNHAIQSIVPPENTPYCTSRKNELFEIVDFNFDGFNDFILMQFLPAAPNIPYYFFVFNPVSKKFERDTSLESITNPEFDPDAKTISSSWRGGLGHYGRSTYKYINGRISLVAEFEYYPDPNDDTYVISIKRELTNGKMKLVEETRMKYEEP